jgi:hypothetical protein
MGLRARWWHWVSRARVVGNPGAVVGELLRIQQPHVRPVTTGIAPPRSAPPYGHTGAGDGSDPRPRPLTFTVQSDEHRGIALDRPQRLQEKSVGPSAPSASPTAPTAPTATTSGLADPDQRSSRFPTFPTDSGLLGYSTVTDLARLRGLSMSYPRDRAISAARICSGTVATSGWNSAGTLGSSIR